MEDLYPVIYVVGNPIRGLLDTKKIRGTSTKLQRALLSSWVHSIMCGIKDQDYNNIYYDPKMVKLIVMLLIR